MTPYELAALIGASSPILRPIAQRAAQLLLRLLRPATDRAAERLADTLFPENPAASDLPSVALHWRARNTALVLDRTAQIFADEKIVVREVPRSWLLPLLEAAGNVEDPDLQEMWARLLASGVEDDECQHPMFVDALRRMSPEDARILSTAWPALVGMTPGEFGDAMMPAGPEQERLHALGVIVSATA